MWKATIGISVALAAPAMAQNTPSMHWLTVGGGYALDTNSISDDLGGNRRRFIYMGIDVNHKAHIIRAVARCKSTPREFHVTSWDLYDEDKDDIKTFDVDIIYKEKKSGWERNMLNLVCRW